MRRSTRAAAGQVRGHLTAALAASVVGASLAVVFVGDPVSATGHATKTVTVTFTDRSPSPESVQLRSGDSVTFVNRLNRSRRVQVAPGVLAEVESAAVRVHGAATTDFVLAGDNDSQTLTYTGPQTVHYTATYTFTLRPVLNAHGAKVVPDTITVSTSGQLIIAAPVVSRSKRSQHQAPAPSPSAGGADRHPGTSGTPTGSARSGTGQHAAKRPTVVVAQVPHGWAGVGGPPAVLGSTDRGALQLPQLATSGGPAAGASTGTPPRTAGLGLPAIIAVALLSGAGVSAALLRTLIVQRRAVPPLT
jgi:hypothetical protein